MLDRQYNPAHVDAEFRPIFAQLCDEFGKERVWSRVENFGQWVSAGVVDQSTGTTATVRLREGEPSR